MYRLCVIQGDGIGKEVVPAAVEVLQAIMPSLEIVHAEAGWETFLKYGQSVPPETLETIKSCGAALFGAVSSPSQKVAGYRSAIITMRQKLDLYSNIRPVRSLPVVSPRQDVNFLIVRENTEGLYSGLERMEPSGERAVAERVITRKASMKIGRRAMEVLATQNRKCLSIVHKANILPVTDGLFRDCIRESVANSGIQCDVNELLVDTAAMKIITEPDKLDVLVTTNLFGDILSDEAAYWGGGIGLAPSLNWGDGIALAEPVHGSAPDITGKGIANPIATILSASMLVRYMWNLPDISNRIDTAVESALLEDALTQNGKFIQGLTTREITRAILERLR